MVHMAIIRGIIFDYNRTLYDQDKKALMKEAMPLLHDLKKAYNLCLVGRSDDVEKRITEIDSHPGLKQCFSKVIVRNAKTAKEFQECLDAMHLLPQEVMTVGDKIKGEISLGNKMGMATVWFRNGKYKDELPESIDEEPAYVITSLGELRTILSQIGKREKNNKLRAYAYKNG